MLGHQEDCSSAKAACARGGMSRQLPAGLLARGAVLAVLVSLGPGGGWSQDQLGPPAEIRDEQAGNDATSARKAELVDRFDAAIEAHDYESAAGVAAEILAIAQEQFGSNHWKTLDPLDRLATVLIWQDQGQRAVEIRAHIVGIELADHGADSWQHRAADQAAHRTAWRTKLRAEERQALTEADQLLRRGTKEFAAGQVTAAQQSLEECMSTYRRILADDSSHPAIRQSLIELTQCYRELGQYSRAFSSSQLALDETRRLYPVSRFPDGHPSLVECHCLLSTVHSTVGDHDQARQSLEAAVGICRSLYGPQAKPAGSRTSAMALRMLARTYQAIGQGSRAKSLLDESQAILAELFPRDEYPSGHAEVAVMHDALGDYYRETSEYDTALRHMREALQMRTVLFPDQRFPRGHRRIAASLSRIATVLAIQNEFEAAEAHHRRSLEIYRRLHPRDEYPQGHIELSRQLASLGFLALRRGQLTKAHELAHESLAMVLDLHAAEGAPHLSDVVRAHEMLGRVLRQQGRHGEARASYVAALAAARKLYPPTTFPQGHVRLFDCLNSMGVLSANGGQLQQAAKDFGEAVAIAEQLTGSISPLKRVLARQNLATLRYSQYDLVAAAEDYQECLATLRQLFPEDRFPKGHAQVANVLMNLGATQSALGEYPAAAQHFEEAASMLARLFPPNVGTSIHPAYIRSLVNLGSSLSQQGRFTKARTCLEEALNAAKRLYPNPKYPNGHIQIVRILHNLSSAYEANGEFNQALTASRRALKACRNLYPLNEYPNGHAEIAKQLHEVGTSCVTQGDTQLAISFYEDALSAQRQLYPESGFPDGHPHIALTLNSMTYAFVLNGQPNKARPYVTEAIDMYRRLASRSGASLLDPGLASALEAAGYMESAVGDYAAAIAQFEAAVSALQRLYPRNVFPAGHHRLASALGRSAAAFHGAGRLEEAQQALRAAIQINRESAAQLLPQLSEAEGLNYLASQPRIRNRLLSIAGETDETPLDTYREIWWHRGAVQRAMATRRQQLDRIADPTTRRQYETLLARKRQIAQLMAAGFVDGDTQQADKTRSRLLRLTSEKEALERELATVASSQPDDRDPSDPIDSLQRLLPDRSAFVDIHFYTRFEFQEVAGRREERLTGSFMAFVTSRSGVQRVELGPKAPIDQAVSKWRRKLASGQGSAEAEFVRQAVWQPIAERLEPGTELIFICPDDTLTGLPWPAIPGESPEQVLLEQLTFAHVPYGEFLVEQLRTARSAPPAAPLLLVGDVDYQSAAASAVKAPPHFASRAPVGDRDRPQWTQLPGTASEIKRVADLAPSNSSPVVLSGAAATTSNVLQMLPHVRRAHFATHGFFADANFRSLFQLDPELFEQRSRLMRAERTRVAGRNPLVLSGLVLAGANRPAELNNLQLPHGDSGILTAESIAGTQLPNLDLVTLSACDSGLGDVGGREGVFGLQRAFHIAGAQTVIASLWKVEDTATQKLMVLFYENLFQRGMSKVQALRHAQLELRQELLRTGSPLRGLVRVEGSPGDPSKPTDALFWASWTLSGDWR